MGSTVETENACVAAMNDRGPVTNTAVANPSKPEGPCRIKGNINDKGERIYHVPGSDSYERTGSARVAASGGSARRRRRGRRGGGRRGGEFLHRVAVSGRTRAKVASYVTRAWRTIRCPAR